MTIAKHKSASVPDLAGKQESLDQRAMRTRQRIDAGFVELLQRRSYDDIRVSGIAKKAAVGRATFYAHYTSKHDLLRSQFSRIVAPMVGANPADPCLLDVTALLAHVQHVPRIYQSLIGRGKGTSAARILRDCFEKRIADLFAAHGAASVKQPIVARFAAAALQAMLESWLEGGARETAGEVQATFSKLVGRGLAG